jgi:hypothetical protein
LCDQKTINDFEVANGLEFHSFIAIDIGGIISVLKKHKIEFKTTAIQVNTLRVLHD